MKSKTSLLDITSRSLSKKQMEEAFDKFTATARLLTQGQQTTFEIDKGVHTIRFVPKSTSHTVAKPMIEMQVVESCQSLENLKIIQVAAYNCGVCRNGGIAKLDNRNISKLEQVLINAAELFTKTVKTSIEEDKVQLSFQKDIDWAKNRLKVVVKKDDRGYNEYYLGKVKGDLDENRDSKNFDVKVQGLSIEQVEKLAEIIVKL